MSRPDEELELELEEVTDLLESQKQVEKVCTTEEIFEAGFTYGLMKAGLTHDAKPSYKDWLLTRYKDRRVR